MKNRALKRALVAAGVSIHALRLAATAALIALALGGWAAEAALARFAQEERGAAEGGGDFLQKGRGDLLRMLEGRPMYFARWDGARNVRALYSLEAEGGYLALRRIEIVDGERLVLSSAALDAASTARAAGGYRVTFSRKGHGRSAEWAEFFAPAGGGEISGLRISAGYGSELAMHPAGCIAAISAEMRRGRIARQTRHVGRYALDRIEVIRSPEEPDPHMPFGNWPPRAAAMEYSVSFTGTGNLLLRRAGAGRESDWLFYGGGSETVLDIGAGFVLRYYFDGGYLVRHSSADWEGQGYEYRIFHRLVE